MKNLSITALFLFLTAFVAVAGPVDLGNKASYTPYDPYMAPVKQVMGSLDSKATLEQVQKLMREGRGFRYAHTDPYNPATPAQTAARKVGDCKDKALWLIDQMKDSSARFVIGKAKRNSKISHAWVMWQSEGRWWVLDCTLTSRPIAADKLSANDYIPHYSYAANGAYRHAATSIMTASTAPVANEAVAAR